MNGKYNVDENNDDDDNDNIDDRDDDHDDHYAYGFITEHNMLPVTIISIQLPKLSHNLRFVGVFYAVGASSQVVLPTFKSQ